MNNRVVAWDFGPPATAEGFRAVRKRAIGRRARTTAGFTAPLLAALAMIGWSISSPFTRPDSLGVAHQGPGTTAAPGRHTAPTTNGIAPQTSGTGTRGNTAVGSATGPGEGRPNPAQTLPPVDGRSATVHVSGSSTAGLTWTVRRTMTLSFAAASVSGSGHYVAVYIRGLDNAITFGVARSPDLSYAIGQDSPQWLPFAAAGGDLAVRLPPGRYEVCLVTDRAVDVSVPANTAGADSLDLRPTQRVGGYVVHDIQGLGGTQTTLRQSYPAKVTSRSVGFAIVGFRASAPSANATISLCLPRSGDTCQDGDPEQTDSSSVNVTAIDLQVPFNHDSRMSQVRDVSVTGSMSAGTNNAVVVFVLNLDLGS